MAFGSAQGILGRAGGSEVIGRGIIDIGVSSYRLRHDMRNVGNAVRSESKLWGQAFKVAAVGLAALSSVMIATVVGGISQAEKFNAAMARLKAMTGVTDEAFQHMRKGVLEMAKDLPQGPEKLAEALYFVASAGFRGADALQILDQAAKAAAASGADLEVSADALVTVMNAYGLAADKATYVSDILTRTVVYGKIEFEDLARAIGPVSTISRVAGISLEEMGAAIAMLTQRGLTARRSTNSLWAALRSLATPTSLQIKTMKQLGIEYDSSMLKSKGLVGVLEMFDKAVKKVTKSGLDINKVAIFNKDGSMNVAATQAALEKLNRGAGGKPAAFDLWRKLLGQSNAFLVSQILLQKTGETYNYLLDKMEGKTTSLAKADQYLTGNMKKVNDVVDTTNKAFEVTKKMDFGVVWGIFVSKMQVALVELGQKFIPMLNQVVNWLSVEGPRAVAIFSGWITSTLVPAAKQVWNAASGAIAAVGAIFNIGGEGGKPPVQAFFDTLTGVVTTLAEAVSSLLDQFSALARTPLFANGARILAPLLGFLLVLKGSMAAANALKGVGKSFIPNFGKGGAAAAAAAATGTGSIAGSIGMLSGAAVKLSAAAEQLMVAARSLMLGGGGGGSGLPLWRATANPAFNGPQFASRSATGNLVAPGGFIGRLGAASPSLAPQALALNRAMMTASMASMFSASGVQQAAQQVVASPTIRSRLAGAASGLFSGITGSLVGSFRTAAGGFSIKSVLGGALSTVGKVFWPLMIADIVGTVFKEPLGDFLSNNPLTGTFFKNAGARMKQDFWDGMVGIVEDIFSGGKETFAAGLAGSTKIGSMEVDTAVLGKLGFDKANIKELQAAQGQIDQGVINTTTLGNLATSSKEAIDKWQSIISTMPKSVDTASEAYQSWASGVEELAKKIGLDTQGLKSQDYVPNAGYKTDAAGNKWADPSRGFTVRTIYDPAKIKALADQIGTKITGELQGNVKTFEKTVFDNISTVGDVKFDRADINRLPESTKTQLSKLAEENVDGTLNYLQQWMTQEAIARQKGVDLSTAKDFTSQAHTLGEQQALALKANLEPLKDQFAQFQKWVQDNGDTEATHAANLWLSKFGDAIENAYNSNSLQQKLQAMQNIGIGKDLRILSKDTKVGDKVFKAGTIVRGTGKKMAEVNRTEFMSYWQSTYALFQQIQGTAGIDQQNAIAQQVQTVIEQGLKDGMSMAQIKAEMPPEMWTTWINNFGGATGGAQRIATWSQGVLEKGIDLGIKNAKTGKTIKTADIQGILKLGKEDPSARAKILEKIAKLLGLDKPMTWGEFQQFFDPKSDTNIKKGLADKFNKPIKDLLSTKDPNQQKKILAWFNSQLPGVNAGWDEMKKMLSTEGRTQYEQYIATQIQTATSNGMSQAFSNKQYGTKKKGNTGGTAKGGGADIFSQLTDMVKGAGQALGSDSVIGSFATSAGKILSTMRDAISNPKAASDFASSMNLPLTEMLRFLPKSPPETGPMAGDVLPTAGANIIKQVALGVPRGTVTLGNAMGSAASSALSSSLGDRSAAWGAAYRAGYNIGDRIAQGIRGAVPSVISAMIAVANAIVNNAPHGSPAKEGPWSGPAWAAMYRAGANITGQLQAGMNSQALGLPGLDMAIKSQNLHRKDGANSKVQKIYADKLQLFNAQDEESILKLLDFMAPGGR